MRAVSGILCGLLILLRAWSVLGSPGTPIVVLGAADQNRHLDAVPTSSRAVHGAYPCDAAEPARRLTTTEKGRLLPIPTTQLPSLHHPRTVRVVQIPFPCEGFSYRR